MCVYVHSHSRKGDVHGRLGLDGTSRQALVSRPSSSSPTNFKKGGNPFPSSENYRKMENQIWEIVAASGDFGDSEVGERQYHILAVNSGLMLCAPDNVSRGLCTVGSRSVRHPSTRWKIVSAGNGAFYIISAGSANLALNVNGPGKSERMSS
ncbi:hypothetical protein FRB93_006752, partial [Tulasnella sp. JGI-2019a]